MTQMKNKLKSLSLTLLCSVSASLNTQLAPPSCQARQFTQALPGYKFNFPRDHASHDDYRTEWWYFTGHLQNGSRNFGYELTFFRFALDQDEKNSSPWSMKNLYLAHFAVTDPSGHRFLFHEKMNRAGLRLADARQDRPYVYNEAWSMEQLSDQFLLRADAPDFTLHLLLTPQKPITIHGKDGVSQKASCRGCASHYYSMTDLKTKGALTIDKQSYEVTGLTWMDHEFGSNQLTEKQVGWDWYSLQLDNGMEIMLYVMRNSDSSIDPNSSGTIINADGSTKHLTRDDFAITSTDSWVSSKTRARYPMGWHVSVPSLKAQLEIEPELKDQELVTTGSTGVTYWEGACKVKGTALGHATSGKSYVEMTGYAEKFTKRI